MFVLEEDLALFCHTLQLNLTNDMRIGFTALIINREEGGEG